MLLFVFCLKKKFFCYAFLPPPTVLPVRTSPHPCSPPFLVSGPQSDPSGMTVLYGLLFSLPLMYVLQHEASNPTKLFSDPL